MLTKSDLVLRDLETLRVISQVYAAISFTIATADHELGKKVEPGAPLVSRRWAAMTRLAGAGLLTGALPRSLRASRHCHVHAVLRACSAAATGAAWKGGDAWIHR